MLRSWLPAPGCDQLELRMQCMERRVLALTALCVCLLVGFVVASCTAGPAAVKAADAPSVLHLKGLVIEDVQGRARILLGAPFPTVPDRSRQDETTSAMVFLDESGHDRLAIGEKLAPQIGGSVPANYQRPGIGYGLTLNDAMGNERGGMGFLSNGSSVGRAVMVLDRPEGDAIGAIVDDNTGYAGLAALYPVRQRGLKATGILLGTQGNKAFLSMQDLENQPRASLSVDSRQLPTLQVFDENGKPSANLLHPGEGPMTELK
jgi:hypothetical protein